MGGKRPKQQRKNPQLNDLSYQINWSYQNWADQMPCILNFTVGDQKILWTSREKKKIKDQE